MPSTGAMSPRPGRYQGQEEHQRQREQQELQRVGKHRGRRRKFSLFKELIPSGGEEPAPVFAVVPS